MGLFARFPINRAIAIIASTPVPNAERAAAVSRLRAIGSRAVPKLVVALTRDPFNALGQLLAELVTNATLPVVVTNGLLSEDAERVNRVKRALLDAKQIDPNRVFELYVGKGG